MRGEAPIGIIDIARSEDIVTTSTSAALAAKRSRLTTELVWTGPSTPVVPVRRRYDAT